MEFVQRAGKLGRSYVTGQTSVDDHPLQGLMSRTGSFPLRLATELLQKHLTASSVLLDPFCGKGTSLLGARMLGCSAFGLDVAPEAVICSAAKLANINRAKVLRYVADLPVSGAFRDDVPDGVRAFFHRSTLSQILSIRERLLADIESPESQMRNAALFTLATLLGILHGHASYSLSVTSAHAYSMAPRYVTAFAKRHGLRAPERDVKACLQSKLDQVLADSSLPDVPSRVILGSADSLSLHFPNLVGKVDLILTSPPYLNAQTYAKDNWLRQWLLGCDYKQIQGTYLQTSSVTKYLASMRVVLAQMALMLRAGGRLVCIAGDVRLRRPSHVEAYGSVLKTAEMIANLVHQGEPSLRVDSIEQQLIASSRRYYHALSNSNGHSKNAIVDRVLIATKR